MTTHTPDHPQHSGREEMIEEIINDARATFTQDMSGEAVRGYLLYPAGIVGNTPHVKICIPDDITDWLRTTLNSLVERVEREKEVECLSYREHLRFVYRWVSRLNGDKPHDRPEANWRDYVKTIVYYPLSPWQTGDWFEDDDAMRSAKLLDKNE